MKPLFSTLHVFLFLLCVNHALLAQSKNYQLETPGFKSTYGTLPAADLAKDIQQKLSGWTKREGAADLSIKITYQSGLAAKQYTKKKSEDGFNVYKLTIVSPEFEAVVKGKDGSTLLKKIYGKEKLFAFFGEDLKTKDAKKLSQTWWKEREEFYKAEELKQKYYNEFIRDLSSLIQSSDTKNKTAEETKKVEEIPTTEREKEKVRQIERPIEDPIVEVDNPETREPKEEESKDQVDEIELSQEKNTDEAIGRDNRESRENDSREIKENEERITEKETTKNDEKYKDNYSRNNDDYDYEYDPEEPENYRDLRDHRLITSLGIGLGNQRDYDLAHPFFGGSIDRYSFDDVFGIDWFFVGGWIGYGKYKYDYNGLLETPVNVTELNFTTRYGVSITRILQDADVLPQVTEHADVYGLIQWGYSIIGADEFIIGVADSGFRGGIAVGGRYSWNKFGTFVEFGRTETGWGKLGLFLKI